MFDQMLEWIVVVLPTLGSLGLALIDEKFRKDRALRWSLIAFGILVSALTWIQMSRAHGAAEKERQAAIVETSKQVSAQVSESVSNSVTRAVSDQYTSTINNLQRQIGTLQTQLAAQGKNVEAIKGSDIVTGKQPIKVEVTNQAGGAASPTIRVSRMPVTTRPEFGKMALQFILTTDRVMNGGKALVQCENKINRGTSHISGAGMESGGADLMDDHTFRSWIESPNWAPSSPLVLTLYFDEADLGKCTITPVE
jgi:hypothetical protein